MAIERYHPLFVEDLSEACRYYDGISDTLGQRFRQRVREMVSIIAERPLSYAQIGGEFRGGLVRGFPYVVVTKDEGVVFKNVYNQIDKNRTLLLVSTNQAYEPYEVGINEILEIWKFVNYIDARPPEQNVSKSSLHEAVTRLQNDMQSVKNMLKPRNLIWRGCDNEFATGIK